MTVVAKLWSVSLVVLAIAFSVQAYGEETRTQFRDVTSIVATRFADGHQIRVTDPKRVANILVDINRSRAMHWSRFEGKVGACSTVLTFQHNGTSVGKLYVHPHKIVELDARHDYRGYSIDLKTDELQAVQLLLIELGSPKSCSKAD